VWGDGGIVVTNDDDAAEFIRLYHNHGLVDRDHIKFWGVNTRLQPVQAVIANRLLDGIEELVETRIRNARRLDDGLRELGDSIRIPNRPVSYREVYQLYQVSVDKRDQLLAHLVADGIDCKVHYPTPLHLQEAAASLGYKRGDFPVCERQASEIITIPAHQHLSLDQMDKIVDSFRTFLLE
jgi:dTDP-4-amino-4,6-dideoxygalactose transaminase